MREYVNNKVDKFLVEKNLKFAFSIVLFLITIFFMTTIVMLINKQVCFSEILAPIMIALSALLASSVAMINLRSTYISSVKEETKKGRTELMHILSKLKLIRKKLPLYKSSIEKLDKFNHTTLIEYISIFSKYEDILNDEKLIYHLDNKHEDLIDSIDTCLFFINDHNQRIKLSFEDNNNKQLERLDADSIKSQLEKIESLVRNTENLRNKILNILDEVSEKQIN